jgi:hypothetical protein
VQRPYGSRWEHGALVEVNIAQSGLPDFPIIGLLLGLPHASEQEAVE